MGFCGLRGGGIGVSADLCATPCDYHRLGQIQPFAGLWCNDVAGLQSFSATQFAVAAGFIGLWRSD